MLPGREILGVTAGHTIGGYLRFSLRRACIACRNSQALPLRKDPIASPVFWQVGMPVLAIGNLQLFSQVRYKGIQRCLFVIAQKILLSGKKPVGKMFNCDAFCIVGRCSTNVQKLGSNNRRGRGWVQAGAESTGGPRMCCPALSVGPWRRKT